jgi:hypothetical protein
VVHGFHKNKRRGNMPKTKGSVDTVIKERKCKKCGKNFIVAVEHRYKEGGKYYCSWTCYNHRKDEITTPKENF